MARSVTATTNGPSKRKEPANGKPSANGAAAAEALLDDPGYRDFFWTYTEEPHRTRRLEIIKAHPEVSPACRDTCRQTN
jgi:sphingolipid delta-4 desaturase